MQKADTTQTNMFKMAEYAVGLNLRLKIFI